MINNVLLGGDIMSKGISRFDKYICGIIPGFSEYDYKDKKHCISNHISYMLNRTQSMFKWDNLPESIPQRILELYLQSNGHCAFYKYNDTLYIFVGGLGGESDVYYMPTIYTIANPALKISKSLKIDIDCVVMPNDSLYLGLFPMFEKYATAITETELSIEIATINSRIIDLITAPDDRTKTSAEKFLSDIRDGKPGVIAENAFLDGIRAQPYGTTGNTNILTNLIELNQYQKASWFNELGLNANYNMKRESLNSSESQLNNDALLPLIDDMLETRKRAVEKVNAMFGTDITVSLASSWEDNQIEIDYEQDELNPETDTETENKGGDEIAENEETL